MKAHRAPWQCMYAKEDNSKCLLGKKPKSDQEYFEILCLLILQAGLNWGTIRKNWQKYRKGFYSFDIHKLAKSKTEKLMQSDNIIKNNKKIKSIIYNAKEFEKIKNRFGSFEKYLRSLKHMKLNAVHELLINKFEHVGVYTAEFYLHCVGYS